MKKVNLAKIVYLTLALCLCAALWAGAGDESAVLTSSVERRQQEPLIKPVWEHVITWTYDLNDDGAETQSIPINGILLKVVIDIPAGDWTEAQVIIKDNGDHTIFDSGEQLDSDTVPYAFSLFEPLSGTIDISFEPDAAPGGTYEYPVVTLRGI